MANEKETTYLSMCTGVGGFELGLQGNRCSQSKSGGREESLLSRGDKSANQIFKCIGFSEIDKYACELLRKKFPNVKNYGDAREIDCAKLPDFDMLCAGFPCQAFSIAGKRRGFRDTRGTLFFEIARILEAKRPKIVVLENVKGILNHEKGKTFRIIIQTLSELGYDVQWMVLNSKFFGVPQNRERVFIIGSLRGTTRPEILPFGKTSEESNKRNTEKQVASSLQHPGHSGGNYKGMNMISKISIQSHSPRTNDPKKGGSGPLISNEHCFTLDRSPHYAIKDMEIRRLTPTECERLQGFPDGWTEGFSDTQRYKMMGNAVTVNVVEAIIKSWK